MTERGSARWRYAVLLAVAVAVAVALLGASSAGTGAQAGTVTSCTTINSSGVYEVTADFNDSASAACVVIDASNVTLEGNGHLLRDFDADTTAVGAAGVSNVTVRNLRLKGFETGVEMDSVTGGLVENVSTSPVEARVEPDPYWGTQDNGIEVRDGSRNVTVRNNYLESPGEGSDEPDGRDGNGVLVRNSSDNVVTSNTITSPASSGIWLFGADNNTIAGNEIRGESNIYRASDTGIQVGVVSELLPAPAGRSEGNVVRDNEILGESEFGSNDYTGMVDGIAVRNGNGTRIADNVVQEVHGVAILVDGDHTRAVGGNDTVAGNSISRIGGTGVFVAEGSPGVAVRATTVSQFGWVDAYYSLGGDGIRVSADNATVDGSDVGSGYGSGIVVDGASGVVVRETHVHDNDEWGVEVAETTATLDSVDLGSGAQSVSANGTNFTIQGESGFDASDVTTATGKQDVGLFYNTTATGPGAHLRLAVTYSDSDVAAVDESTLSMWRLNGSWANVSGADALDAANNTVVGETDSLGLFAPLADNEPPIAMASVSSASVSTGDVVTFEALASSDPDGELVEYRWDFDGDGSVDETTASASTSHVYSAAGTYEAVVTVVDSGGDTNATALTVSVSEAAFAVGEAWPKSGYDLANTGYAANNTGPVDNATEKWTYGDGPVVATENTVYLGLGDAVRGVYANDADWQWYQSVGSTVTDIALHQGTLYVGTPNSLTAVSTDSGDEKWSRFEPATDMVVYDGMVYAESEDYFGPKVAAFHATNGTLSDTFEWSPGSDPLMSTPAVRNDTLYVGGVTRPYWTTDSGFVYAVDPANGNETWQFERGTERFTGPAVWNGTVYAGSGLRAGAENATFYAIDADTGNETWNRTLAGEFAARPAVGNGTVYVTSRTPAGSGNVTALDAADGSVRWQRSVNVTYSAPAVANETVYVGGSGGSLYALNATDGSMRWNYTASPGDAVTGDPVVAGGTVYVVDGTGTVHAVAEQGSANPSDFEITDVDAHVRVTEGERLVVNATVENTGSVEGTQTVSMSAGGAERASETLTLAAGTTANVSFAWNTTAGDAGAYTATLASDTDETSTGVSVQTPDGFVPISSCTPLTQSGKYVVSQSISDGRSSTCLEVTASNVTIDGQGHTVSGVDREFDTTGVYVGASDPLTNVTVRNVTLVEWEVGLRYGDVFDGRVTNGTASNLTVERDDTGVFVEEADGMTIRDVVAASNDGIGVRVESAPDAVLRNVVARNNEYEGVSVESAPNATVRDGVLDGNDGGLVVDSDATGAVVRNVTVRDDQGEGIVVGAADATVRDSLVANSEYEGVVAEAPNATVTDTVVRRNEVGVLVRDPNVTVTDNRIYNNTNAGVEVAASGTTAANNTVRANRVGVSLHGGQNATFDNTTLANNTDWAVDGRPDGERASRNNTFADVGFGYANATLSFTLRDAALRPVDAAAAPAPPSGSADLGVYLNATNTSTGGALDLTVAYSDAVAWTLNESTLSLWRHHNGTWSDAGGSVDANADTLSANVTAFSVFAPLAEPSETDDAPPDAAVTYSPEPAYVGETVTLDASASSDLGGDIAGYEWDFDGSGTTDAETTGPTVEHAFESAGTYAATVTVVDEHGLTDTASVSVRVQSEPVASFTHSPTSPSANETVTLDGSGSTDADGSVVGYEWDTDGDGQYELSGESVDVTYEDAATRTVELRVTDDDGNADSVTETIDVQPDVEEPSVTNASLSPSAATAGENVTINATVENPASVNATFAVTLTNDTRIISQNPNLTVPPGTTEVTMFTRPFESGTYNLSVNGVSVGVLDVEPADTSDGTGAGTPGFGVATAVVAVLAAAVAARSRD